MAIIDLYLNVRGVDDGLNKTQKLRQEFLNLRDNLRQARNAQEQYRESMTRAKIEMEKLDATGKRYRQGTKTLTAEYQKQFRVYSAMRRQYKGLSADINKLNAQQIKLTKGVGKVNKAMRITQSLMRSGTTLLVRYLGAFAAFNEIRKAISVIIDFDAAMQNVYAITAATATEMEQLRKIALDMGGIFDPKSVAETELLMARLGFEVNEIASATPSIVKLAIATGEDLTRAGEIAASVIRGFRMEASETGDVAETLAASLTSSALSLSRVAEAIKYVAPVAEKLGWTFDDVSSMMGKLADAQIFGSIAGTSLRNIMAEIADKNSELNEALGGNVNTFDDFIDGLIGAKNAGIDLNDIFRLVPKRATSALAVLIQNAEVLKEYRDTVRDANKELDEMVNTQMESLENQLSEASARWKSMLIHVNDNNGAVSTTVGLFARLKKRLADEITAFNEFGFQVFDSKEKMDDFIKKLYESEKAMADAELAARKLGEAFERAANIAAEDLGISVSEFATDAIIKLTSTITGIQLQIADLKKQLEMDINLGIYNLATASAIAALQEQLALYEDIFTKYNKLIEQKKKEIDANEVLQKQRDDELKYWRELVKLFESLKSDFDDYKVLASSIAKLNDVTAALLMTGDPMMIMYAEGAAALEAYKDKVDRLVEALKNYYRWQDYIIEQAGDIKERNVYGNVSPGDLAGDYEGSEFINYITDHSSEILSTMDLISGAFSDIADAQVEAIDRIVDRYDTMVGEAQSALETELRLMEQGYANNVDAKRKELEQLKVLREEALKDQQKYVKQQQLLESITQAINMTSAVSGILKNLSINSPWALFAAPAAIAALFALWRNAKVQAINEAYSFGEGGWIDGKPHSKGGVMINAEGGEHVTNKKSAKKYAPLLDAINADTLNISVNQNLVKDLDAKQHLLDMIQASVSLDESKTYKEIRELNRFFRSNKTIEYHDGYRIEKIGSKTRKIRDN